MLETTTTIVQVKEYYGEVLQSKQDLKTSACCTADAMPVHIRSVIKLVHEEILDRFYGCGSPIPPALEGATILDLGCGTGRDAYVAGYLAGERGRSIGIDMTDAQLEVARRHLPEQMSRFGFAKPNVEFHQGYIEALGEAGIEDDSVDVVISNCVINLSPQKERVFAEIHRVLRPGGELYFSDVFADRRIPEDVRKDPVIWGECLGGALYMEDFRRILERVGFKDFRVVTQRPIEVEEEIAEVTGPIGFSSVTVRAFKLDTLEDRCEDYGQVATYLGTVPEMPHAFVLDDHHTFPAGKPMLVCGNTASMLEETRFGKHFRIDGDHSRHFGLFDCAPAPSGDAASGGCC